VVQLIETVPAGPADFEDVRQEIDLAVSRDKVAGFCRDTAAVIWEEVQSGADLKEAAQTHGETYDLPDPFKRDSYVKGLGRDPLAIGAAFALTDPGEMSGPVDYDQGTVIIKLIERTSPELTQFTEQRDSLRTVLLNQKQQAAFGRWYQMVQSRAEVENNVFRILNQARDYM
jgi:parvulin-like peptidyl-prolyl isomerase